ncbi:MAG: hypothetical protein IIZ51_00385 [Lachnospiraceae bacterium]|nr:hypothetical protein [Lachnospiraceae bacterium]
MEVGRLLGSTLNGDATEETIPKMRKLCEMIAMTSDCAVGVVATKTEGLFTVEDVQESWSPD